ncbi:hypothetical protein BGZ46_001260 [Entomortierella lignicola]|nr:hypothetical protein BGZ46_001260 [Entomortierella lignicola]
MGSSPIPTDNQNHCSPSCANGYECFLYPGGTACQPFQAPQYYPLQTGLNSTAINPPGWYLASGYPSVRYTGSLVNQVQGANCTTIPVPKGELYQVLVGFMMDWDMADITTYLEQEFSSTLVQYRGNCAEGYYCQPNTPVSAVYSPVSSSGSGGGLNVQGQLAGTCQALKAEGKECQSSEECSGWHIHPDHTYNNDQFRCAPPIPGPSTGAIGSSVNVTGVCTNMNAGQGVVGTNDSNYVQSSAKTYLLTTIFIFFLVILFLWYRRFKQKQRELAQQEYYGRNGNGGMPYDNTTNYLRQGGVYRPPDENDNGELPAYGQHRRDERLVGPATEEIGMYSFSNLNNNPNTVVVPGSNIVRPAPNSQQQQQQSQQYPLALLQGSQPLYPPATTTSTPPVIIISEPSLLARQQAEAAAISAAATAALPTPVMTASQLQRGSNLPPAYEASTNPTTTPTTTANQQGENSPLNSERSIAAAVVGTGEEGEKQGYVDHSSVSSSPRQSYNEKPISSSSSPTSRDPDQASNSSGSASHPGDAHSFDESPFKD